VLVAAESGLGHPSTTAVQLPRQLLNRNQAAQALLSSAGMAHLDGLRCHPLPREVDVEAQVLLDERLAALLVCQELLQVAAGWVSGGWGGVGW